MDKLTTEINANKSPVKLVVFKEPLTTISTPPMTVNITNHVVGDVFSPNIKRLVNAVIAGALHKIKKVLATDVYLRLITNAPALITIKKLEANKGQPLLLNTDTVLIDVFLLVNVIKLNIEIAIKKPNKKAASKPSTPDDFKKNGIKAHQQCP